MNILLIGPPGTGKGTMADEIEQEFGLKHISAGDLLREEVKNQTALGKQAAPIMKAGKLVDDKLVAQIINSNVPKYARKGFVLDGFPRNLAQAKILEEIFSKTNIGIDLVLLIETEDKKIIGRLSSRRQCPVCKKIFGANVPPKVDGKCDDDHAVLVMRDDDKPDVVKKRLQLYHGSSRELIDFYKKKNLIKTVDGNSSPQLVFEKIKKILAEKK